jgi:hypothetical protein
MRSAHVPRGCNSRQFILKSSEEDLAVGSGAISRAPSPETRPAGGIQDRRLVMAPIRRGQVLE